MPLRRGAPSSQPESNALPLAGYCSTAVARDGSVIVNAGDSSNHTAGVGAVYVAVSGDAVLGSTRNSEPGA